MKRISSLKRYIILSLFITSAALIFVLSSVSIRYFFLGLDAASAGILHSQALYVELGKDEKPVQLGEVTVAAHWSDLPQSILDHFNEAELAPNQLAQKAEGYPLFSPPKRVYFVMKVIRDNKIKYASMIVNEPSASSEGAIKMPLLLYIVLIAIGALSGFAVVILIIFQRITAPVKALRNWAKSLNEKQLSLPTPDFRYSELNMLADIIKLSLQSVKESVEREQRFLGYASHELRTPIAVTRTNAELLRKMIDKNISQEKQLEVLDRIERAGINMTDLTETLLWLNRQEDKELPKKVIVFGDFIKQISDDLSYLLKGKSVELTLITDGHELLLPDVLCRVVITNLIRNAFQHTSAGDVLIQQEGHVVSIRNQNTPSENSGSINQELGFGLGLELTERLVNKYGWRYQSYTIDNGYFVELSHENTD
ncbi:sensor histidine kinase [Marinomonas sp. 2405UD66-6]|uniref:sensor histidine kinase n=1 Tax=Marinomonas sp. 2405UD66-6 TaxID=3391834 RepID=UPI0039C9EC6B